MDLHSTRRTVLPERTLGDTRENIDHRVEAVLLRLIAEVQHAHPVGEELPVEELIHHIKLHDDVDQAKGFAEEVSQCVRFVGL